jgi:6-pyruvoyl-tetrahydropterin synthase
MAGADKEFRKQLRQELKTELSRFNELEQAVATMWFQLDGHYLFEVAEIGKMLKRSPEEIRFIIDKITNHLEQRELLHALPKGWRRV